MKRSFLIFSGYNQRAVIAFCREAKRLNADFSIIARDPDDDIFLTSYRNNVLAVRKKRPLEIDDVDYCINQVKSKTDFTDFVILPSTEFLNRFFLNNKQYYEDKSCIIPLVSESLYSLISNKLSFGKLCKKYGLKIPEELTIEEPVTFPFVAKPVKYFSGNLCKTLSPYLIYSEKDWTEFKKNEKEEDFYFQEYVTGKSYYLLYYISKHGRSVFYSQENLVQQAEGKSIILARSASIHHSKIAADYSSMLKGEGFEGLIMIELKYKDGDFCMIEANPRLWGPSQLFVDSNVPIFEEFIRDRGFCINSSDREIKDSIYFWHGGIVEDNAKGKALSFHDFSSKELEHQMDLYLSNEIYRREDTQDIYNKENSIDHA